MGRVGPTRLVAATVHGVSSTEPNDQARPVRVELPLRSADLERLDRSADRRGVTREEVIAEAIDAFLAREMWSGAYIPPPPRMEVPRSPWRAGAFRIGRRRQA